MRGHAVVRLEDLGGAVEVEHRVEEPRHRHSVADGEAPDDREIDAKSRVRRQSSRGPSILASGWGCIGINGNSPKDRGVVDPVYAMQCNAVQCGREASSLEVVKCRKDLPQGARELRERARAEHRGGCLGNQAEQSSGPPAPSINQTRNSALEQQERRSGIHLKA